MGISRTTASFRAARAARAAGLSAGALAAAVLAIPAATAQEIGVAAAVNPRSLLERGATERTLVIRDEIRFEDRVITSEQGLVQVLFVDGSTFTIGAGARVVIDEFVFDPATGGGELVADVAEGALRFVGGRLSKGGGEVRFGTQYGTLGVRGAIVEIDLDPVCPADARCPDATASLVFGDELLLELPDGGVRRIHEQGYAFTFFGPPGAASVGVVPLDELDRSDVRRRLAGRPGESGGADAVPTDETVVASGIPNANSDRAPFVVVPRPKPEIITTIYTPDEDEAGIATTTDTVRDTVTEGADGAVVRDDVIADRPTPPTPPTPPVPPERPDIARVSITPESYLTRDGAEVDDPGNVGIVGPPQTFEVAFEPPAGEADGSLTGGEGDVLPVPAALGESTVAPYFSDTADTELSGVVFRGPDDFSFYYLAPTLAESALTVGYVLYGEPTPPDVFFRDSLDAPQRVRSYAIGEDYQRRARGISSDMILLNPLVAREFGIDTLALAAETPFYVADKADFDLDAERDRNALTMRGGLLLDGVGPDQRSAVTVDVGFLAGAPVGAAEADAGRLVPVGSRRGSYRLGATSPSASMRGPTGAVELGERGDRAVFGRNGDNFVYSSGLDAVANRERETFTFFDRQQTGGRFLEEPGEVYSSTMAVASLSETVRAASLDRPERTLRGFAAGMMEPDGGVPFGVRSGPAPGVEIRFDPEESTIGGLIKVRDVAGRDPVADFYEYAFGSDVTGTVPDAADTRGTYVDADTYAAVATGPANDDGSPTTVIGTDDGAIVAHAETDPGTYVVAADAVPQPRVFEASGVEACECAFLEWGWWGSQTDFESPALPDGRRADFAHLGTWAAGEIARREELPEYGTGTWEGHAVGNVTARGPEGERKQYIAVGDMRMEYDFAARYGTVSIDDFDGRSFSGPATETIGGARNGFGVAFSGSGLTGSGDGAFVRGPDSPVQGVVGSFGVEDAVDPGAYRAFGTFVGEQ